MRGIVFLVDLILFSFLAISIMYLLVGDFPRPIKDDYYHRLACDIAFVIESKKEISHEDIKFILSFIPKSSFFEINGRVYYFRDGKKDRIFSCKIENTTVRIGI